MKQMTAIRLCCIARDEAASMPALAAATKTWIDSWLIVHNGPPDGTREAAEAAFAGVPGRVVESELAEFDFGSARNEMLSLAAEPGIYLLVIDPDCPPVGAITEELTEPVYCIEMRGFGKSWWI